MPKGERLSRLLTMLFLLQTHPGLSAEELARRCRVSLRTCFRDLNALQDGGVPLYNDHGYRLATNTILKSIYFTLEEAVSLIYGLKLLQRQKGLIAVAPGLREKLLALLPSQLMERLEEIEPRVEVVLQPAVDYSEKMELFKWINRAIMECKTLHMVYYSFSRDEVTKRRVDPYRLIFKDGFWYLVAYCHCRQNVLLFRVDRIRHLKLTKDRFDPPELFDFETYMGSAWQMERGAEFTFRVRFSGDSVRFVRETVFHATQRLEEAPDGTLLYEAKACGLKSVARWVLSFGADAEVLEPEELREYVCKQARELAKRYGDENG